MRIVTYKDTHYFKDIDLEIVYAGKVACKDLSGQSVLLELGVLKQPDFGVPNGYHGCQPSVFLKSIQSV